LPTTDDSENASALATAHAAPRELLRSVGDPGRFTCSVWLTTRQVVRFMRAGDRWTMSVVAGFELVPEELAEAHGLETTRG
jgi:hypothetical protein